MSNKLADHYSIRLRFQYKVKTKQKKTIEYRLESETSIRELRANLNMINWNSITSQGVNHGTNSLIETIKTSYDKCCPLIRRSQNKRQDPINKWMTQELISERNRIKKLLVKSKTGNIVASARYRIEKKLYRVKINTAKQNYYRKTIEQAVKNPKKVWGIINELEGKDKNHDNLDLIRKNNTMIYKPEDISSEFSKYYQTAARNLASNIPNTMTSHKEYLTNKDYEWGFTEVGRAEVLTVINSMKNKRSSGYDGISNSFVTYALQTAL